MLGVPGWTYLFSSRGLQGWEQPGEFQQFWVWSTSRCGTALANTKSYGSDHIGYLAPKKKHRKLMEFDRGVGISHHVYLRSFRIWPLLLLFFGHRLEGPFARLRPGNQQSSTHGVLRYHGVPESPKRYPKDRPIVWNNAIGVLPLGTGAS